MDDKETGSVKNKKSYTYDEAVDLTVTDKHALPTSVEVFVLSLHQESYGVYNYLLLGTCSLITNACALDMFGFATVVAAASCDLNLNLTQLGILASAPFAGVLFAFPWGFYADTQGRKRALIISTAVGFVFAVTSSFSTHWIFMLIVKIIGCSFSAAGFTLTMAILGESTGYKHRSRDMFIVHSFNVASEFVSFALAWVILPLNFIWYFPGLVTTFRPWRLYTIVLALPLGIGSGLMFYFYESPKFLASKGEYVRALEVLRSIYKRNGGNIADYPVKNLTQPPSDVESTKRSFWKILEQQTFPIFRPPLLWRTIQLFFLMMLCCATNNVFVMWYPTIVNFFFNSFNAPGSSDQTFCQRVFGEANISPDTQTYKCNDEISTMTLYSGMVYGLFYCLVSLAVSKVSSRPRLLLISILVVSGTSMLLVNLKNPLSNMIFFTLLQAPSLGIGCIYSYFVDLYPTNHRGLVMSLSMMFARSSSLVGVSVIGSIITQYCEANFYAWSFFVFSGVVVALFLPADRKSSSSEESST